jgi:phosphatidylglycerol:prolipoprotein diacylglycerol transferase
MFEALQIGPFFLWTRVIFLLVGVWLFVEFFLRLAQSANLSLQHFKDHWPYYAGAFLVSGRVFAILAEYRVYVKDPLRLIIIWDGGWSFLGGAIGIGIVLAIVTRGHRSTFLHWLDALVPAACFGLMFSWIGLFFAGQGYGKPTDLPWAVTYDAFNVRYAVPIHPVQLYYAFFYFVLTFVLLIIRKYGKRSDACSPSLWRSIGSRSASTPKLANRMISTAKSSWVAKTGTPMSPRKYSRINVASDAATIPMSVSCLLRALD